MQLRKYGVGDGTRTHNAWNHNPVLCQLNYTHHIYDGTPGGTRTPDLLLRRQLLYPAELLAHFYGAGDGNRTRVSSLEGWCSTIELHPHKLSCVLSHEIVTQTALIVKHYLKISGIFL